MERVLQSRALQGSESLRSFLRFVVTKAIDNEDSQLKEYTIATEVFGRSGNYDPRTDSVVRVQAGRLRAKLQEYYAGEGRADKVLIDLPKGHYNAVFSYAQTDDEEATLPLASAATPTPAPQASAHFPAPHPRSETRLKVALACVAALALVLGALAFKYHSDAVWLRGNAAPPPSDAADLAAVSPFWDDFLRSPEPILVAYSNPVFEGRPESGMRYLKPLDSSGQNFGSPQTPPDQNSSFITDHYTGVGEVMGVYFLGNVFWKAGRSFHVKRSLMLTWDDVKTQNLVVLGSTAENLILRELPQQQDFVFRLVKDDKQNPQFGIVNLRPQPGEERVYFAKEEGGSSSQMVEDYTIISMLKGLDSNRRLLNLAGIKTFGTQAAAEYITKPEFVKDLISRLNTSADAAAPVLPAYYQILLKVKINGGVPVQISYVTHHVLN